MGHEEGAIEAVPAQVQESEGVALILLTTSESGALTADARRALSEEIDRLSKDPNIVAIVLRGDDRIFATGAGLNEDELVSAPSLCEICDRIEALEKPVVAAIAGAALGGGLELALAAHLRVATPGARLGAPEITLGLVPSAGGTQRLPKVVGGIAALKMLLSGRAVSGESAHKLGLVDLIETEDLIGAAIRQARLLAESEGEPRRSSVRRDRLGEGTAFLEAVASHRKVAVASALDAPLRLIECVEAALLLPYDVGRGMEQAAYDDLVVSDHSHALRHVFAAERRLMAVSRWEGRTPSRPLKSVGIVGVRGLGAELVVLCLDAGFEVLVTEESDAALEEGVTVVIEHYDRRVASGAMTEEAVEATLDRMRAVAGYKAIEGADVVVDPLPGVTKARLGAIDAAMRAGAVLLTSAEGVDVQTLARQTGRPGDIVGMHFFPAPRKNRLVELSVPESAGPRAVSTARAFARKIDRLVVERSDAAQGIGTRLMEALHAAADLSLEDGASVSEIDAALRDWGVPLGSFAYRDVLGIARPGAPLESAGQRGSGIDAYLVRAKRRGIATGRGYYVYPKRGRPGIEDPEITGLIAEDRRKKGIRARPIEDGLIRKRALAAMAGAGAAMLQDGTAFSPSDIDMVAVHGLGFARRTGGVMHPADRLGLRVVADLLTEMARDTTRIAPPGPVLTELVRSEKSFSDLID